MWFFISSYYLDIYLYAFCTCRFYPLRDISFGDVSLCIFNRRSYKKEKKEI
nr:MAG TPA: hypothetical protein [Caudoviricetes sp.]